MNYYNEITQEHGEELLSNLHVTLENAELSAETLEEVALYVRHYADRKDEIIVGELAKIERKLKRVDALERELANRLEKLENKLANV